MESLSAFSSTSASASASAVLPFACSPILALFRRPVPQFPLDPCHLLQIVDLVQYALAIPSQVKKRMTMPEHHERGRTS
jgi:hypothetical protein